jgi:hypothetical protein
LTPCLRLTANVRPAQAAAPTTRAAPRTWTCCRPRPTARRTYSAASAWCAVRHPACVRARGGGTCAELFALRVARARALRSTTGASGAAPRCAWSVPRSTT